MFLDFTDEINQLMRSATLEPRWAGIFLAVGMIGFVNLSGTKKTKYKVLLAPFFLGGGGMVYRGHFLQLAQFIQFFFGKVGLKMPFVSFGQSEVCNGNLIVNSSD